MKYKDLTEKAKKGYVGYLLPDAGRDELFVKFELNINELLNIKRRKTIFI